MVQIEKLQSNYCICLIKQCVIGHVNFQIFPTNELTQKTFHGT